jgi:hypothetical protein
MIEIDESELFRSSAGIPRWLYGAEVDWYWEVREQLFAQLMGWA